MLRHHGVIFLVIILFYSEIIMTNSVSAGDRDALGENCGKNWAVVPYTETQNLIFPSFNEKIRRFTFDNIKDEIVITQNWDGQGVSAVVWEAAIELTKYLSQNENLRGKRVLELGAGTGLVGIACAKLGANVTATDMMDALPFLSKNIDLNFKQDDLTTPKVQELQWGENLSRFRSKNYDFIIGADVIYIEDTFDDLLDTIYYLAGCKGHDSVLMNGEIVNDIKPTVFLSAKMRYSREEKFMNRMKKFFHVDLVFSNEVTNIHIYEARLL